MWGTFKITEYLDWEKHGSAKEWSSDRVKMYVPKILKLGLAFMTHDRNDHVHWPKVKYHSVLFHYKDSMRGEACISTYVLIVRLDYS